jgi:uncharacterized protein YktA (UPF0223 family)
MIIQFMSEIEQIYKTVEMIEKIAHDANSFKELVESHPHDNEVCMPHIYEGDQSWE